MLKKNLITISFSVYNNIAAEQPATPFRRPWCTKTINIYSLCNIDYSSFMLMYNQRCLDQALQGAGRSGTVSAKTRSLFHYHLNRLVFNSQLPFCADYFPILVSLQSQYLLQAWQQEVRICFRYSSRAKKGYAAGRSVCLFSSKYVCFYRSHSTNVSWLTVKLEGGEQSNWMKLEKLEIEETEYIKWCKDSLERKGCNWEWV